MDLAAALKNGKKNSLSREQAMELYNDLRRNVNAIRAKKFMDEPQVKKSAKVAKAYARPARPAQLEEIESQEKALANSLRAGQIRERSGRLGQAVAITCVLFFAVAKVGLSALEFSGVLGVEQAQAAIGVSSRLEAFNLSAMAGDQSGSKGFSKEEVAVLTSLDARRVELEERAKRLEDREADLNRRDRDYAARQTQLREMTETLKLDREKGEKKRNLQIEQLANVYGSMDPKEAAALIEQLDATIALALLERMPEKRIGQILALMSPARALTITRMLSEKA